MARLPSDGARAGDVDVELVDVSLAEAEVTDGLGAKRGGGGFARARTDDAVSEDSDGDDEERGLLRGDAGDASTSAPHRDDPRPPTGWRAYVARVPKGEAVMLAATFTFAF